MRSGGLTRYAVDLMEEQAKSHNVYHLYPGNVDLFNKNTRIIRNKNPKGNIEHYELINSLPLPIFRGVKEPKDFMVSVSPEVYTDFLKKIMPETIHIHTLMGIHKEFLITAKNLGIKIVYTTHDYYGICPTINLYKDNKKINCTDFENGKGCAECSRNALGTKALLLSQTPFYPILKKAKKFLLKKNNVGVNSSEGSSADISEESAEEYVHLREYYFEMFRMVDYFHFNSSLTEKLFKEYMPSIKGEVVGITHRGINKGKVDKSEASKIRLGYLGPFKDYKGFFFLLEAFKDLPNDQFELHLYGDETQVEVPSNVFLHGRYDSSELSSIFSSIDVLVIPSLWKETFGFVVLEALSNGTPVIISDNVGSKDLVQESFGVIFKASSPLELNNLFRKLDKNTLQQRNKSINQTFKLDLINEHVNNINNKIYS
ncbi:glycosyltransferase [Bacillus sp. ISL-18]|uniref:glycosyltransferase n=1 Tax=Bacillus sp. ISL-18 TaxID=2819118 RepID=UPI001BE8516B|nr:glycosyltransferase [Bacillus sp. ISL-18]MBT2658628.1 glycosyltransferase [Bacillus sp. ISL-18]